MADHLKEHERLLRLAVAGKLPERVDKDSQLPMAVVIELYETKLLKGVRIRTRNGDEFLELKITLPGREYLSELEQKHFDNSMLGKMANSFPKIFGWVFGILGTAIGALLVMYIAKKLFNE